MADKDNEVGSVDDIQEQIRKLEKEKEELEKKKQLERLRLLKKNVSSLKTSVNSSPGAGPSERIAGNSQNSARASDDFSGELNISLEESQAQIRSLQQDLLNSSVQNDSRDDYPLDEVDEDDVMTPQHKQALRANRDVLVDNMTPDDIFNDLISKHIFSNADVSRIKEKNTVEAMNEELLNILIRRSDRAFHVFVASLRRTLQGWLANRLMRQDAESQTRNKRKRRTGEINVNVDCERVVPTSQKRYSCQCHEVEEQILRMARDAFANIRRRDATPGAFEQYHKEIRQTNQAIKESIEIMETIKMICRHGELTNLSSGSVCFTVQFSSLAECQEWWDFFQNGSLKELCQNGLVTASLLRNCGASDIQLCPRIEKLEYLICALELAHIEMRRRKQEERKPDPFKRRLRQKTSPTHNENGTDEAKKVCTLQNRQVFQEIPKNIMSFSTKRMTAANNFHCLCHSGCSTHHKHHETDMPPGSEISDPSLSVEENLADQHSFISEQTSGNNIWLRSQEKQPLSEKARQTCSVTRHNKKYSDQTDSKRSKKRNLCKFSRQNYSEGKQCVLLPNQKKDVYPYNLRFRLQ